MKISPPPPLGTDPTVISISLIWAFDMFHKDFRYRVPGVHMIFATALSVAVEIYISPLLSYMLTIHNCCLHTAWVASIIASLSHPFSKLPPILLFSTSCMVSGSWRPTITGSGVGISSCIANFYELSWLKR